MARGVNKVILIGNLGKDPEVRKFPNGDSVCNVSLATSDSWTDKQSGEKKERTEWHNVVFLKRSAEIAGQYLHKGSKVYIEGSLRTRDYEKDGVKRYVTEVVVRDMQMLDGPASGGSRTPANSRRDEPAFSGGGGGGQGSAPFEDDDIPFRPRHHKEW